MEILLERSASNQVKLKDLRHQFFQCETLLEIHKNSYMHQNVRPCCVHQLYLSMRLNFYSYAVVNSGSFHVNLLYGHFAMETDTRLLTLRVNEATIPQCLKALGIGLYMSPNSNW